MSAEFIPFFSSCAGEPLQSVIDTQEYLHDSAHDLYTNSFLVQDYDSSSVSSGTDESPSRSPDSPISPLSSPNTSTSSTMNDHLALNHPLLNLQQHLHHGVSPMEHEPHKPSSQIVSDANAAVANLLHSISPSTFANGAAIQVTPVTPATPQTPADKAKEGSNHATVQINGSSGTVSGPTSINVNGVSLPMQLPMSMPINLVNGGTVGTVTLPNGAVMSIPTVKMEPQEVAAAAAALGAVGAVGVPVPVDPDTIRELIREQSVKKQRLARKAELARMSRKRKKTRLNDLEVEVSKLVEDLERERKQRKLAQEQLAVAQHQIRVSQQQAAENELAASMSDAALAEEWKRLSEDLRRLTAAAAATAATAAAPATGTAAPELSKVIGDLANLMKKKNSAAVHQMKNAHKYMTPALPLRFLEWVMNQKDTFYEDCSGLWNTLFAQEVGLSDEQVRAVLALRPAMQAQRAAGQEVQQLYTKLCAALQAHLAQSSQSLERLTAVLSPDQLARFLAWVDSYGSVCVQINV